MLRLVLDHVPARTLTVAAAVVVGVASLVTAAFALDDDGSSRRVRAAGADIRAADAPSTPELVRREALEQAIDRRAARARAAREAATLAGAADAKGGRYAVEPRPEPPAPVRAAGGSVWDRLARCESGGNWAASAGLYEGGLQFHPSTWDANKPAGYPDAAYRASRAQQIHVAERVLAGQGWGAWPACASELGLR